MTLPLTIDAITPQWLTEALSVQRPGVRVKEVEIVDVIYGTSTKIRISPTLASSNTEIGLPPTLIVKGGFEAHSPTMQAMYLNEMRFYRDVQPRINMRSRVLLHGHR